MTQDEVALNTGIKAHIDTWCHKKLSRKEGVVVRILILGGRRGILWLEYKQNAQRCNHNNKQRVQELHGLATDTLLVRAAYIDMLILVLWVSDKSAFTHGTDNVKCRSSILVPDAGRRCRRNKWGAHITCSAK